MSLIGILEQNLWLFFDGFVAADYGLDITVEIFRLTRIKLNLA